ncbi:secreted RxLR effector peptide protein, putative [Phytophthora infestans T30-4]
MGLRCVLLMTVVYLLAGTNALLPPGGVSASLLDYSIVTDRNDVGRERSLRLTETTEEKDSGVGEDGPKTADERSNPISNLFSQMRDKLSLYFKTETWLELGKSSEYVKRKLGLEGLQGTKLTSHKNYKRWVKYSHRLEKNQLLAKAQRKYSTFKVWNEAGLEKITGKKVWNGMPAQEAIDVLKSIQSSDSFKYYQCYITMYDGYMINLFGSGYYRPDRFIDERATAVEKMARAYIWADNGIDERYVREFLGLLRKKDDEVLKNPYYRFYKDSLKKGQS